MKGQHTFGRDEKLKSRKLISRVFSEGSVHKAYPLKAHFLLHSEGEHCGIRVTFVVPKRCFKKATDRNRIKRQIREAYRLQKLALLESYHNSEKGLAIVFVYNSNVPDPYETIYAKMGKLVERLKAKKVNRVK